MYCLGLQVNICSKCKVFLLFLLILFSSVSAQTNQHVSCDDRGHKASNKQKIKFDISKAVAAGSVYQEELCPQTCAVRDNKLVNKLNCAPCYCDKFCDLLGDCCPHVATNIQSNLVTNGSHIREKIWKCIKLSAGDLKTKVVTKCRPGWSDNTSMSQSQSNDHEEIRMKCSNCRNNATLHDIVTSRLTNITYCNMYCLACHEHLEHTQDMVRWDVSQSCPQTSPDTSHTDTSHTLGDTDSDSQTSRMCHMKPVSVSPRACPPPARELIHRCVRDLDSQLAVDSCTALHIASLCDQYYWPVYHRGHAYRNLFCYICQVGVSLML